MDSIANQTVAETEPERDEVSSTAEDSGLRFADPYWDEAFCAWWDPTLRTCC